MANGFRLSLILCCPTKNNRITELAFIVHATTLRNFGFNSWKKPTPNFIEPTNAQLQSIRLMF